jgi:hypothetical protein
VVQRLSADSRMADIEAAFGTWAKIFANAEMGCTERNGLAPAQVDGIAATRSWLSAWQPGMPELRTLQENQKSCW